MASKSLQGFSRGLRTLRAPFLAPRDPVAQCLAPRLSRSMATETAAPVPELTKTLESLSLTVEQEEMPVWPAPDVLTTVYKFPTMEPLRYEYYPANQLHLPLRRDILHRAVIFEGDNTRQGTASTKTRWEVHGSHRKIRPQKGTGRARLGTRQSPMLRGGAKAFGPRPRDFGTKLPKKMYDLAWRTALSYRYRRGELVVCDDGMDITFPYADYARAVLARNAWGRGDGRSLFITNSVRTNLFSALEEAGEQGRAQTVDEVDVKDLLELGRIIIEKSALDSILGEHSSDLNRKPPAAVYDA